MKLIKHKIKKISSNVYFNTNYKLENSILVSSMGRSGSTWVSNNIINYNNKFRYIFEPLHPRLGQFDDNLIHRYIPNGDIDVRQRYTIEKILNRKIRYYWTDRHSTRIIAQKRIIKSIRTNLIHILEKLLN